MCRPNKTPDQIHHHATYRWSLTLGCKIKKSKCMCRPFCHARTMRSALLQINYRPAANVCFAGKWQKYSLIPKHWFWQFILECYLSSGWRLILSLSWLYWRHPNFVGRRNFEFHRAHLSNSCSSFSRSVFNIFLMSLCVSDFISSMVSPFILYRVTWGFYEWAIAEAWCKVCECIFLW